MSTFMFRWLTKLSPRLSLAQNFFTNMLRALYEISKDFGEFNETGFSELQ